MAHAAAFPLADSLSAAFKAGSARALKVSIVDETFVLEQEFPSTGPGGEAADFASVKASLTETQPCYVLFHSDSGEWMLMSYVPDEGIIKQKMLYSSAKDTLRRQLGGAEVLPKEQHWSDLADVALAEAQSATARAAEQESLMTATEKLRIEGDRLQAIEAAGDKMSSVVGLSFPLAAPAKSGLTAFVAGTTGVLVLAIDKETIVCKASAPQSAPAGVGALLPANEPCYCLYRWAHERAGASATSVVFAYFCPEESPVRLKMLHASTKGAILQTLPSLGVEVCPTLPPRPHPGPKLNATPECLARGPAMVRSRAAQLRGARPRPPVLSLAASPSLQVAKSIEGVEAAEFTEAELVSQVYGAEKEQAAAITKAAPKGGRRLVKKKTADAVDVE